MDNQTIRECVEKWCNGFEKDKNEIIEKYGHISDWDVSNVTDMCELFKNKKDFNENINNWDVSNVTNMEYMFSHAKNFNQPLYQWNISNVKNMGFMFSHAKNFNQPLYQWNVSNVTNMTFMFYNAISFNQNIFCWNISIINQNNSTSNSHWFSSIIVNSIEKLYVNVNAKIGEFKINIIHMTALFILIHKIRGLSEKSHLDIKKMLDHSYFYFEYRKDFIMFLIDNGFRYINEHYNRTVTITKQTIHPSIEAVFGNEDLTRFISKFIYS